VPIPPDARDRPITFSLSLRALPSLFFDSPIPSVARFPLPTLALRSCPPVGFDTAYLNSPILCLRSLVLFRANDPSLSLASVFLFHGGEIPPTPHGRRIFSPPFLPTNGPVLVLSPSTHTGVPNVCLCLTMPFLILPSVHSFHQPLPPLPPPTYHVFSPDRPPP